MTPVALRFGRPVPWLGPGIFFNFFVRIVSRGSKAPAAPFLRSPGHNGIRRFLYNNCITVKPVSSPINEYRPYHIKHNRTLVNKGRGVFSIGATDWDRTSNLRLRRPTLYPIELQSQQKSQPESWRREGDSNPRYGFTPYDDLANRCLQPLSHPSYALETNTEGRPLHAPSCASVV